MIEKDLSTKLLKIWSINLFLLQESIFKMVNNYTVEADKNELLAITTAPGNELSDLCLELSKNKIVVAAAANNYDGRSFPACYESVCGVRGGKIKNNKVYEIDTSKEIQCLFDNNPLMSMTLNNEYQMLPTNNSLITAKFTGMICQCISKYDIQKEKYTDILQIMQKENREQKSKIYTSSQEWYMDNNDELLQAIYEPVY